MANGLTFQPDYSAVPPKARNELVDSVIHEESRGHAGAVSNKGAVGLMQIEPDTARAYGFDPERLKEPDYNRHAGSFILGDYIRQQGGDERKGLIAYNEGPGRLAKGTIYPSTAEYADRVLAGAPTPTATPQPSAQPTPEPTAQPSTIPSKGLNFAPDYEQWYSKDAVTGRAFDRNQGWAKAGPYQTKLEGQDEQKFRAWFKQNGPNLPPGFDPEDANADYDMRGFYKALKRGDPRARGTVNPYDKRIHLPDYWKTPYHHSFSQESVYATKDAPHWVGDHLLVSKDNKILWDDKASERENLRYHDRIPGETFAEEMYTPQERQEALGGTAVGLKTQNKYVKAAWDWLPLGLGLAGGARGMLGARPELLDSLSGLFSRAPEAAAPSTLNIARDTLPSTEHFAKLAEHPEATPALKQEIAGIRPAIHDPETGTIYHYADARHHGEVFDRMPPEVADKDNLQTGFVDQRGTYMSRKDALDQLAAVQAGGRGPTAIEPPAPAPAVTAPMGAASAGENAAAPVPTVPAMRPVTPMVTAGRPETPYEPSRPAMPEYREPIRRETTPVPPARPETAIPPSRPTGPEYDPATGTAPQPFQAPAAVQAPVAEPPAPAPVTPAPAPKVVSTPSAEPPQPVSAPPPQQIAGMDIEQGDRDFANWLKGDGSKDAGIYKFVNDNPKAAERRLMLARRFYVSHAGEASADDIAKIMGVPKNTAKIVVKGLDALNPAQETPPAPLELSAAPAEAPAEAAAPAEETGPSQAELEAAGQGSMFGPSPAPKAAAPAAFKPAPEDAEKATLYTPASFAAEAQAGTTPMPFKPSNRTFMVPTDQIGLAPEHFQFKIGGDEQGGGLALTGITQWDPDKADPLTLWHDSKGEIGQPGKFYVVNGHQRMGAAKRLGVKEVEARVYDSGSDLQGAARQNVSMPEARARGAMINFGQGRGSEIDAATYMRDAGMTEADLRQEGSVDLSEDKIRTAGGLAELSPQIWNEVAIGRMEPKVGAVIGRELAGDTAKQVQMAKNINQIVEKGGRVNAQQVEDWINVAKLSPEQVWTQKDLFGAQQMRKNLFEEMSDLWREARSKYGLQTSANKGIAKNKAIVEKGATSIDVQTAKQQAALGEKMRGYFDLFHKLPGSKAVEVTKKYAGMLANEPTQGKRIKALYMRDLGPALEQDAKALSPQAELPATPKQPVPPMEAK